MWDHVYYNYTYLFDCHSKKRHLVFDSRANQTCIELFWLSFNQNCFYISDLRSNHAYFFIDLQTKPMSNFLTLIVTKTISTYRQNAIILLLRTWKILICCNTVKGSPHFTKMESPKVKIYYYQWIHGEWMSRDGTTEE